MTKYHVKRWAIITIISITVLGGSLFIAGMLLSQKATSIFRTYLDKSLPSNISIDFDTCEVSLINRTVTFLNVRGQIQQPDQPLNVHKVETNRLSLRGIHVFSFILNKKIEIRSFSLDTINLVLNKNLLTNSDSVKFKTKSNGNLKSLAIDKFEIENLNLKVIKGSIQQLEAKIQLKISDITIPSFAQIKETLQFKIQESSITDIFISPDSSLYNCTIQSISMDNHNIKIDTIKLIPMYTKFDFGKHVGKQIDRFEVMIPTLKINQIEAARLRDSVLYISSVNFYNPSLKAFRDKRLPFIKDKEVPMPIELIRMVPYQFSIDTIGIVDASIAYEEFPVEGDSSGIVYFENLTASFYHMTNDTTSTSDHIDLDVETTFMRSGLLKASFDLPLHENSNYSVNGTLSNLPITELNPAVTPLAKMQFESGHMKLLSFQFTYDAISSSGEVEMNYENLKILSLKEKERKTMIHKLKTFLLNIFIAKNKNEDTVEENRKGTISFERDPKRSIFNYWWKSLFSGVKDCYGVGKIM